MSNQQQKKNTFFGGVAILSISAIIVKIIGAIYRIPLTRLLTDEAYADYAGAYNIYSSFLTISTAGLPVALSKMISEAHTLGRYNQMKRIFSVAVKAFLTMGIISFLGMSVFARQCATYILGNEKAVYCVMALAPSVLCVCIMSSFRGYNQGQMNMVPTTVSQIIESLCKMFIGLALVYYIISLFIMPDWAMGFKPFPLTKFIAGAKLENDNMAAVGALIGVSIGSVIALVYMLVYHGRHRIRANDATDTPDRGSVLLKRLLSLAIPITLGSAAISLVTLIDGNLVMNQLTDMFGSLDAARTLYGMYQKTMPVYNLPAFFMVALTASVIPSVSSAIASKDHKKAQRISQSAMKIGYLIACPMGVGLFVLGAPICEFLLDLDGAQAGPLLSTLGLAAIFVCIYNLTNSILQSNNLVYLPIVSVVVGGIVKIAVNLILVGNPDIHIYGAPVGTLCCFIVASGLNLFFIKRTVPAPPQYIPVFGKITISSAVMGAGAWGVYGLASIRFSALISSAVAILVAVVIYAILVIILKVFSLEDMKLMPKGDKIAKILRIS